jgi:hypothetical protein
MKRRATIRLSLPGRIGQYFLDFVSVGVIGAELQGVFQLLCGRREVVGFHASLCKRPKKLITVPVILGAQILDGLTTYK